MEKVYYKEPFDFEIGDEGVYRGKRYKLIKIEQTLHLSTLVLNNGTETIHNVAAYEFAVRCQ